MKNPYDNALRVLTRRYMNDFQFYETKFEEEDGPIPDENNDDDESNETELKEAA